MLVCLGKACITQKKAQASLGDIYGEFGSRGGKCWGLRWDSVAQCETASTLLQLLADELPVEVLMEVGISEGLEAVNAGALTATRTASGHAACRKNDFGKSRRELL